MAEQTGCSGAFCMFGEFFSPSLQLKQKMGRNRNSTSRPCITGLLKHVVSGTSPLSGIPASDGKGSNQESQCGAGAGALVSGGYARKGAVSVFIQLAAFPSSDSPQRRDPVERLLLG